MEDPMFDLLVFEAYLHEPPDAYSQDRLHRVSLLAAREIRRLRAELCRRGAHIGMVQPEVPWTMPKPCGDLGGIKGV
jgi:hypothetical protein